MKPGPRPKPIQDRLWDKINKTDSCWLWTASKTKLGYGKIGKTSSPSWSFAHREVWKALKGPIPKGLNVLHKCDNPPCVNPEHLFVGTMMDNMQDKIKKGRQRSGTHRGEDAKNSILTTMQVLEIRKMFTDGNPPRVIAKKFGIRANHVSLIVHHRCWKHLP